MAEYIDRAALGIGMCNPNVFNPREYGLGWNAAIEILQDAPAADVVEVVRCKDCKHFKVAGNGVNGSCDIHAYLGTYINEFCSDGERKEN